MQETSRDPTVGLIQLHVPSNACPTSQYLRAEPIVRSCANDGADLIVLPEMALGMSPKDEKHRKNFSLEVEDQIKKFQRLAEELNVNIIPGSFDEITIAPDGGMLTHYNTTCYIDRTGTILQRYRKVNLWGDERNAFTPGTSHESIETEYGKVGLLVCWDLGFPEAFRALIKQGVRIIVIPTHWKSQDCGPKGLVHNAKSEKTFINSVICARAYEHNACIVFCNAGGGEEEGYFGCSQITLPFKGPITIMDGEEGYSVTRVEFGSILEDAEDVWGIRADVDREDWYPAQWET